MYNLKMGVMATALQAHSHRQTLTHITAHSQPDKIDTLAHTPGVNVKASTLKGHSEAQIHLCLHSSCPFATHTYKKKGSCSMHTYSTLSDTDTTLIHKQSAFSHLEHTHATKHRAAECTIQ